MPPEDKNKKAYWVPILFLGLTALFLYPIFFGKVFFPGDLLYRWLPWSLSDVNILKEVLPINNPLLGDPVTAFYPWYTFLSRALSGGFFPLWNPYVLAGAPFLANWQSGVLAVQNLVFYVFKTPSALNISIFSKLFLTLGFMYLFLRKIKLSKEASVFGGITYAFSAFFIVWLNWPQTRVAVWLPLILFTLEYLFEKPNLKSSGFVSLAVAAAIFAGHPGTLVQVFFIIFIYAAIRLVIITEERLKKSLLLLLGLIFGLGIGSMLILPGYELMKNSYQYGQRNSTDFLKMSLSSGNIILLFFPQFYGILKDGIYKGPANFNEVSVYVGLLPLFFSFWAITFARKTKKIWPILALVLFSFPLIYGLWPQSLLYKLPLVSMQATQRYIFILSFALAALGAIGFDKFFAEHKRKSRLIVLSVFFIGALGLTFYKILPVVWSIYKNHFFLIIIPFVALFGAYQKNIKFYLKWIFIGLLVLDLFLFGIRINSYIKADRIYSKNPVTTFINKDKSVKRVLPMVDAMLPNSLMPYGVQDLRGRDALITKRFGDFSNLLNDKKSLPQLPNFVLPNKVNSSLLDFLNVKYVISEIPIGNTLPRRRIRANGFVEVYKDNSHSQSFIADKDNLAGVGLLIGTFKRPTNPSKLSFKVLDAKGKIIRKKKVLAAYFRDNSYYYFSFKPIPGSKGRKYTFVLEGKKVAKKDRSAIYMSTFDQYSGGAHFDNNKKQEGDLVFFLQYYKPSKKFKSVFKYKSLTVYENKNVLPRAYAVGKPVVVKNTKKALSFLKGGKINYRKQVILDKKPLYGGKEKDFQGQKEVKILSYKPNGIVIDANLEAKSIIVVSDTYYRGWKAFIDGKEAPILVANTSFRAIAVNKGKHRLKLSYQPASFRHGTYLSLLSLLIVFGLIGQGVIRRKNIAK